MAFVVMLSLKKVSFPSLYIKDFIIGHFAKKKNWNLLKKNVEKDFFIISFFVFHRLTFTRWTRKTDPIGLGWWDSGPAT